MNGDWSILSNVAERQGEGKWEKAIRSVQLGVTRSFKITNSIDSGVRNLIVGM